MNRAIDQTEELKRISEALEDPKLKPKALRYIELKEMITPPKKPK